jgi:hypothetical protein
MIATTSSPAKIHSMSLPLSPRVVGLPVAQCPASIVTATPTIPIRTAPTAARNVHFTYQYVECSRCSRSSSFWRSQRKAYWRFGSSEIPTPTPPRNLKVVAYRGLSDRLELRFPFCLLLGYWLFGHLSPFAIAAASTARPLFGQLITFQKCRLIFSGRIHQTHRSDSCVLHSSHRRRLQPQLGRMARK